MSKENKLKSGCTVKLKGSGKHGPIMTTNVKVNISRGETFNEEWHCQWFQDDMLMEGYFVEDSLIEDTSQIYSDNK